MSERVIAELRKPPLLVALLKRPLREMIDVVASAADPNRVAADILADEVREERVRTNLCQYARHVL